MTLQEGAALDIAQAIYKGGYRIDIEFSDGHRAQVDFGPFLRNSLNSETRRFLDPGAFQAFRIAWGSLVWGDYEMCFAIEDLYTGAILKSPLLAVAEDRTSYETTPDSPARDTP